MSDIQLAAGIRTLVLSISESGKKRDVAANRLATGKRVNAPLDNPTNYFASVNHLNRAKDFDQLRSAITQGILTVRTAMNGIKGLSDLVQSMHGVVDSARMNTSSADRTALAKTFDGLRQQLNTLAADSGYQGLNLIGRKSSDPLNFQTDNLTINFNPEHTSSLTVNGAYLGTDVILNDNSGGTPWFPTADGQGIVTGMEGTFTVGSITKVQLMATMNRPASINVDSNGNGVVQPGEGMDIDARLTNGSAALATGVAINNTTITTVVAGTATPTTWPFDFGGAAAFANIPPGVSAMTTPNNTDFDLSVPPAASPTARFRVSLDLTANGKTVSMLFGPLQLDKISNGQLFEGFTAPGSTLSIQSANYQSNQFNVQFNDPPPPFVKSLQADRKGLGILQSWMYEGFQTNAGIDAAGKDLDSAMDTLRRQSNVFASNLDIPTIRDSFAAQVIAIAQEGALNLTAADMNEESATVLMANIQESIGLKSLSLSMEGARGVLKVLG